MHTNQTNHWKSLRKVTIGSFVTLSLALVLTACSQTPNASAQGNTAGTNNNSTPQQQPAASAQAPAEPAVDAQVISEGGELVITPSEITDQATFYPLDVDGVSMEVLAVKAPDGTIRTAFNTCQICYDSGRGYYKQSGDRLVCQNCGNQFPMDSVEIEAGGCNPWPIFDESKTVTDESIGISYDFLKQSQAIFENWKQTY